LRHMGLGRHGGLETALRAPGDCGSLENPYDGSVVKVLGHKAACWSSKVGLWEGTHRKFLGPRKANLGSRDVKSQISRWDVLCPGSWEAEALGRGDLQGGERVEQCPEVGGQSRCC